MSEQLLTATQAMTKMHKSQPQPEWVKATESDVIEANTLLRKHEFYCGVAVSQSGALMVNAWGYPLFEVADALAGLGFYPDDAVIKILAVNNRNAWRFNISLRDSRASVPLAYPFYKVVDPQAEHDRDVRQTMEDVRYG